MTDLARHIDAMLGATAVLVRRLLLIALVVYGFSGTYSVEPGEIAVHLRCGRVIDDAVPPGIHLGLPAPFDEVVNVPVKRMKSVRIDDFAEPRQTGQPARFTVLTGIPTCCLTGDNNIVTISCVGQYTIQSAERFLYGTTGPEEIFRRVTGNALIHCLAGMPVDAILTTGKAHISEVVRARVNQQLDRFGCGLRLQFLELKSVSPPELVQENFRDVIKADIDRKKMINEAESYRNQRLSGANAEAERTVQEAMAYRTDIVARASGETKRFLGRLSEYEKNPAFVRQQEFFDFYTVLGSKYPRKIILSTRQGRAPARLRLSWPR